LVDLDGDGDLDVAVSNDDPDEKLVHLNDGSGHFAVGPSFGEGEWPTRHLRVADLNSDGLADAILANRYGPEDGPSFLCFGVPGGGFSKDCVAFAEGSATTITPGDFTGDGALDLVVPHRDGGQSFLYLNDGRGGFTERRPFGPPDAVIRAAEPADLNADGYLDLAIIDEKTGPAVLWGWAEGAFSPPAPLNVKEDRPYAVAIADLDQNGRLDLLVGYVESQPVIFFSDGAASFTPVPFGDDEGIAYAFAVGDLDEDGFLDIAMARSNAPNMLYFGAPGEAQGD
jgi:hypothetical protein